MQWICCMANEFGYFFKNSNPIYWLRCMSYDTSYAFIVPIWTIVGFRIWAAVFLLQFLQKHINYLIEWTKSTHNNPFELIFMHVRVCCAELCSFRAFCRCELILFDLISMLKMHLWSNLPNESKKKKYKWWFLQENEVFFLLNIHKARNMKKEKIGCSSKRHFNLYKTIKCDQSDYGAVFALTQCNIHVVFYASEFERMARQPNAMHSTLKVSSKWHSKRNFKIISSFLNKSKICWHQPYFEDWVDDIQRNRYW